MATVTVNQHGDAGQAALRLGAFAVQRFFAGGSITSAEKDAAATAMAPGVELLAYHWSGGIGGSTFGQVDFAPGSMGSARNWNTGAKDPDEQISNLDRMIAKNPAAKFVLVLFDHPEAAIPGLTRTVQSNTYVRWDAITTAMWNNICTLLGEWFARYGTARFKAVSYGQEGKGLVNRTDNTVGGELDAFAGGFNIVGTYLKNNFPTIERWYPHWNNWASESSIAARQTAMNALLAGGNLSSRDETTINRLLSQVDPTLVSRFTTDNSILNISGDTWSGDYATVLSKTDLEYHVARRLNELMAANWGGTVKPVVAIESYFDVNQQTQDWANRTISGATPAAGSAARRGPTQSSVLTTAILMGALRGGITHQFRWEPQEGTAGSEAPDGNVASYFDLDGLPYYALTAAKALVAAIPPGTQIYPVASDNANIKAVAGGSKCYVLNTSNATISVGIAATAGNVAAVNVLGYEYATFDLPNLPGGSAKALPALVQQSPGHFNTSGLTDTSTLPAPATAGNLLVAAVMSSQNGGVTDITDPAGWVPLVESDGGAGINVGTVYAPRVALYAKIAGGGETTFTGQHSAAGQRLNTWIGEFSNPDSPVTLDGVPASSTSGTASTTAFSSGGVTGALANSLYVAAIGAENIDGITLPAGWTAATVANEGVTASNQRNSFAVFYRVAAPGTYTAAPSSGGATARQYSGVAAALEAANIGNVDDHRSLSLVGVG